jgi:hypothetical protein
MSQTGSWFLLLILGILLVVVGFTGTLGKIIAVVFAPGALEDAYGGSSTGGDF